MPKIVDPEEKRQMIAQAACHAITQKGIAGVTMLDIAAAAGVTTGMIANYFANKEAIITAALRVPFENLKMRIDERLASGENELADILEAAIPVTKTYQVDTAVWVSFWGLIATDETFRQLNARLHEEGQQIFARAVRAAWPETAVWPEQIFARVLRGITTFIFGLSAGGVTNPQAWTEQVQREQLQLQLTLMRAWGNQATAGAAGPTS